MHICAIYVNVKTAHFQNVLILIIDSLYWDEEKKCIMQSITVQGGDVEQIPFEG